MNAQKSPNVSYADFLTTIYDEQSPIGKIGRGTHYSVFGCTQWRDENMKSLKRGTAKWQRFSVIWDEDHDTRVIHPIWEAYFNGLLSPVVFIGERKGALSIIVNNNFWGSCDQASYYEKWNDIANCVLCDSWSVYIQSVYQKRHTYIVEDEDEVRNTYLQNILNLWPLGIFAPEVPPDPFEPEPRDAPVGEKVNDEWSDDLPF